MENPRQNVLRTGLSDPYLDTDLQSNLLVLKGQSCYDERFKYPLGVKDRSSYVKGRIHGKDGQFLQ